MSDEKLRHTSFTSDDVDATADTEREPPQPPPSTRLLGAALSVLWWETEEPKEKE